MRVSLFFAAWLASAGVWAQSPQMPAVQMPGPQKQVPQQQQMLYRLVPAEQPAQQQTQYMTVQAPQPVTTTYAAQPQYAAMQTTQWTASPVHQHQIVLGPGPIALSLSHLGQCLASLQKTHVWTIQHTAIRPVVQMAAPTAMYTVQMVQQQPQTMLVSLASLPPAQQLYSMPVPQPAQQLYSVPAPQPAQQLYRINAPSEEAPPPPVVPVTPPIRPVVVPVAPPAPPKPTPQSGAYRAPAGSQPLLFGFFN